jgi:hypothetical protein
MEGYGPVHRIDDRSVKWIRRALSATLLSSLLFAAPVFAQDVPWDSTPKKKPPAAKAPAAKAPAAKSPAAPAAKAPAAKAPVAKAPAAKAPVANAPAAKAPMANAPAANAPVAKAPAAKAPAAKAPTAPAELKGLLGHFHDVLAPHGAWIDHPDYGTVWIPNETEVGKDFAPYASHGRWAVTEPGDWAWVSNHDWGKIPFHYGRWVWTRDKSWAWIPDREYAPAWVVWRTGEAGAPFVGWAPMAPTHYLINGAPVAQEKGVLPFVYVASRHLFSPNLSRHVIDNQKLGARAHEQSSILATHFRGLNAPLEAASPTFDMAQIPGFAIPRTRIALDAEAIKPIVLAALQAVMPETPAVSPAAPATPNADGRFATPPGSSPDAAPDAVPDAAPDAAPNAAPDAQWQDEPIQPPAEQHHQLRGQRRVIVRGRDHKPRYRCHWTNTRPRIWRCGY